MQKIIAIAALVILGVLLFLSMAQGIGYRQAAFTIVASLVIAAVFVWAIGVLVD